MLTSFWKKHWHRSFKGNKPERHIVSCFEIFFEIHKEGKHMKTVLTIAGSDPSGGAGIQADIKTMTANGVYAMSAITALTAGNTTGVSGIMEVTPEFLGMQLDSIFTDIYPDAVKIGMVSSAPLIEVIAEKLKYYNARNMSSIR
jgi:hydroxymethylpyrimidine/phosphomethylpyrimidine kinase